MDATARVRTAAATGLRIGPTVLPGEAVAWVLAAGLTTAGLALLATAPLGSAGHLHGESLHVHGNTSAAAAGAVGMALAMMSPMAIPVGLAATRASLRRQGAITAALAVCAFAGVWALASIPLHLGGVLAGLVLPSTLLAAAIAVWCAARQFSRAHDSAVRACHRSRPIRPGSATTDAASLGASTAVRCLATCAWPMALTVLAPSGTVTLTVTALIWAERLLAVRPRLTLSVGYLAVGGAAVLGLP